VTDESTALRRVDVGAIRGLNGVVCRGVDADWGNHHRDRPTGESAVFELALCRDDDTCRRQLERQPSAALHLHLVERRNTTQHAAPRRKTHRRRDDEVIALPRDDGDLDELSWSTLRRSHAPPAADDPPSISTVSRPSACAVASTGVAEQHATKT
jgi:hypothetical protein